MTATYSSGLYNETSNSGGASARSSSNLFQHSNNGENHSTIVHESTREKQVLKTTYNRLSIPGKQKFPPTRPIFAQKSP